MQEFGQLTLFAADSLANHSPWQESGREQTMIDIYSQKCLELSKNCDQLGLLARMLLESSAWRSRFRRLKWTCAPLVERQTKITITEYRHDKKTCSSSISSKNSKKAVIKSKHIIYRLVVSMPSTNDTGFSLWRTPQVGNATDLVRLFPTPTVSDATMGGIIGKNDTYRITSKGMPRKINQNCKDGSFGLGRLVKLLPTPTANCFKVAGEHGTGGNNLQTEIGGQLNPDWVEWLMGLPLGWTTLDGPDGIPDRIDSDTWHDEPEDVPRLATGVPNRVPRIKGLGNMVMPQQVYPIFEAIMKVEKA